jgi:hypothetical protein
MPDGDGGWAKHGAPGCLPPQQPSVHIAVPIMCIPLYLPVLVAASSLYLSKRFFKVSPDKNKSKQTLN